MERYREYKDSGEQWLGEIPSHWDFLYLRVLLKENSIQNSEGNVTSQLQFKYGSIIKKDNQDVDSDVIDTISKYTIVLPGDIVINGLNLNYDFVSQRIGQVEELGVITSAYICLRPTNYANRKYLLYLLKAMDGIKLFHGMGTGVRMTLSYKELKNKRLPVPPLSEQTAMVAYLDRVTVQIDKAIAQQQRMIDLLNERKQIIIQHAVTKGLDPNAEMVDSGVEWIGEMPKGWKSTPLRFVFEMRNGYTPSKNDPSFWNGGTIPWFRMEDIRKRGRFLKEATQYVTTKAVNGKGTFSAGSYIMAICTASIGEHAMLIADSLANQRFANFKICKSLSSLYSPMFLYYYFFVIGDFCRHNENSTCFQYVDMDALKNFPILQPSMKIQNEIVSFLDKNLERLEVTLKQTEKRISLLRERKQIIINEVVTGKVKVN